MDCSPASQTTYFRHLRAGETPCPPCKRERRDYLRVWRANRNGPEVDADFEPEVELTEQEKEILARIVKQATGCGTRSGVARHQVVGEELCALCAMSLKRHPKSQLCIECLLGRPDRCNWLRGKIAPLN